MARRAPRTARLSRIAARCLALSALCLGMLGGTAHAGALVVDTASTATEGGPSATYAVSLDSRPAEPVTVRFAVDRQLSPIPDLVIQPDDWSKPHPVTAAAIDDAIAELTHVGTIEHATSSVDSAFTTQGPAQSIGIVDNDHAGVLVVAPAGVPLGEGQAGTWQVSLTSEPTHDVTLAFAGDPQLGIAGGTTLVFTPTNWGIPQGVDVLALDDDRAEGSHAGAFSTAVASDDHGYGTLAVPDQAVTIEDDDVAGVEFDAALVRVQEGGSGSSYGLRLTSQPTHDVVIDLSTLTGQAAVTPTSLTFTPGDWNLSQVVAVAAVADTVPETSPHADHVTHAANSNDVVYASVSVPDMPVEIGDDDTPNVIVTDPQNFALGEADAQGTERQIGMRLTQEPVGEVQVRAFSDGQVMLLDTSVLRFDASNWKVDQFLRIRAADDDVAELDPHSGAVSFEITAPHDPAYGALHIPARNFSIDDDEVASISCTPGPSWEPAADGTVPISEHPDATDHTVGCYLTLGTAAVTDVTFTTTVTPGGQVLVDRPVVTIPAGSRSSELVQFTAVDDAVAEARPHAGVVTFAVSTSDPVYGTIAPAPVELAITEDDEAGVAHAPDSPVKLAEGAEATVKVRLRSQPTAPVAVNLASHPQLELGTSALLFTSSDWNVEQEVRVRAVQDAVDEQDPHPGSIAMSITSSDPVYSALDLGPIALSIADDDVAGIAFESAATGELPEGATRSYQVSLTSMPTHTVTVDLSGDDQLAVANSVLTFTPSTWNVAQEASAVAVQDTVYEGSHSGRVTLVTASDDPTYAPGGAGAPAPYAVTIADDEQGGATVEPSDGGTTVTEAGGTDSYTVVLKAQPTADVVVRVNGGGQVTANPAALTFTATTWDTPQTVTVAAVQDDVDEADSHEAQIAHAVETTAAGWAEITLPAIAASVTDDDTAKVSVSQSEDSTRVVEGAKEGDVVTFSLATQPSADVTITPRTDAQLKVDATPLVFTPANWKEPKQLTVRAVDDEELEGDHNGSLTMVVASTDRVYGSATLPGISVQIHDNDSDVMVMPEGDDGGGVEEDETAPATRRPRGGGGGREQATSGGGSTSNGRAEGGDVRRSAAGAERTEAGIERTDEGLRRSSGRSGTSAKAATEAPAQLTGDVVKATEKEERAAPKPKGPGLVAKAGAWVKRHWEVIAPVAGVALMGASAATMFLKGDPMRGAERAIMGKGGGAPGAPGAPGTPGNGGDRSDLRRAKKKKKQKRRDDAKGADGDPKS